MLRSDVSTSICNTARVYNPLSPSCLGLSPLTVTLNSSIPIVTYSTEVHLNMSLRYKGHRTRATVAESVCINKHRAMSMNAAACVRIVGGGCPRGSPSPSSIDASASSLLLGLLSLLLLLLLLLLPSSCMEESS